MAQGKTPKKTSREQRKTRTYQVIFVAISLIVLLTMILSLTIK